MKSRISFFFALTLAVSIFTFSCSKSNSKNISDVTEDEQSVLESFINGKVLSKNASLCLLGRDSLMHPVIKLYSGQDVLVLELDGVIDAKSIQNLSTSTGADPTAEQTEYVHIVYDNMDFWLDKSVLAMNAETAVVIENAFLYQDASLSQKIASNQNPLKFGTLIAKSVKATNTENKLHSEKIFYYDAHSESVKEVFVLSSSISSLNDDIAVSKIVESLKVTTRAVPRNELFAAAAKYKPSQKVLAALNAQKIEKKTYNYQEVLESLKTIKSGVHVDELLTVDQSKDPFSR